VKNEITRKRTATRLEFLIALNKTLIIGKPVEERRSLRYEVEIWKERGMVVSFHTSINMSQRSNTRSKKQA
jgi:hypothetical protein